MAPAPSAFVGSSGAAAPSRRAHRVAHSTAPAATPVTSSLAALTLSPVTPSASPLASAPVLHTQLSPLRAPAAPFPNRPAGAPAGTIVVVFRADLRVDDHAPLVTAMESASCVVPVFCFDPRHFGRTAYGFEKTGRYRACFLLESVKALRETFKQRGADLVVRIGKPEEVVPDICKRVGAKRVFMHSETTYEEQQVEEALDQTLGSQGAELKRFWGNTLYHVDDIPFGMDKIPDVYSDFRESVEKKGTVRPPLKAPEAFTPLPAALDKGKIPTLRELNVDDLPDSHLAGGRTSTSTSASGVSAIVGGEPEAMRRVRAYVDETRRTDANMLPKAKVSAHLGADFSCRISPWLALGCVSPRRIYDELKKTTTTPTALSKSATYFELVWRDFFRFITCKYSASRIGKSTPTAVKATA